MNGTRASQAASTFRADLPHCDCGASKGRPSRAGAKTGHAVSAETTCLLRLPEKKPEVHGTFPSLPNRTIFSSMRATSHIQFMLKTAFKQGLLFVLCLMLPHLAAPQAIQVIQTDIPPSMPDVAR